VHDMFTGKSLTSGYLLLATNPLKNFEGQTLWMTVGGVRVGSNPDALSEIEPQDFLVVFVECLEDRDDWQSLSSIGKPLDNAIQAKLSGRNDEARLLLVQAKVAAMASPDLTRRDGKRVVAAIDAYYKDSSEIQDTLEILNQEKQFELNATVEDRGNLHLSRALKLLPATEAAKLPKISIESLLWGFGAS
jgi:hypothetical protein